MVSIVNIPTPKQKPAPQAAAPQGLSEKDKSLLQILGLVIAERPEPIRLLLEDFSIEVPLGAGEHELVQLLLEAVAENDADFNRELASVILDCRYERTDFKNLSSENEENFDEGTAGIIGGISTAIGSVAHAIGSTRQAKEMATANTLQGIYAYRAQAAAAEQGKQKSRQALILGVVLLLGIGALAFFSFLNRSGATRTNPIN